MDDFLKMDWGIQALEELEQHPQFIPEDKIADSYIYLNFSEELDSTTKSPPKSSKTKITVPGKTYFLKGGDPSCLNKFEQEMCLKAIDILQCGKKGLNPYDQSCIQLYNNVKCKISEENKKYLDFVKTRYMIKLNKFKMGPNLKRYAEHMWNEKLKRCLDYPQLYKEMEMVSYSHNETDISIEMIQIRNVLELGTLAKCTPPSLLTEYKLKTNSLPSHTETSVSSKLTVAQDVNINKIIESNNVDVVISSSGLKRLLDFTDVNSTWNVPIVVKEINIKGDNGLTTTKNVIFIDKPLPKKNPDLEDFNRFCTKLLLKTNFCNDEAFSFPNVDIKINKTLNSQNKNEKEASTTFSDHKSTTTDYLQTDDAKNAKMNHVIHHNVSYRIWNMLPKDEQSELMKTKPTLYNIKVLVRCKLDCCESSNNGALQPVTLSPKIEYQLEYGGSISTKSELVSEWTSLYFRPFSHLYRIRTHYNSGNVIMLESCNINKITSEAQVHYEHKLHSSLGVLYKIFVELKSLIPGNYLLRHLPKHGPFVSLMKETNENATDVYNLHNDYDKSSCIPSSKLERSWCPLDVNLILPIHRALNRMPGMFKPNENTEKKFNKQCKKRSKKKQKKKKLLDNSTTINDT